MGVSIQNGHYQRQFGFTLIEIIMVLVIMGVLSTLVAPRLTLLSSFDQKGFKDQLKASLAYARKTAVARRRVVCVTLTGGNPASASFKINTAAPESLSPPIACTVNLDLPANIRNCAQNSACAPDDISLAINSGPAQFLFDTNGQAIDAYRVLLTGSPAVSITLGEQSLTIESTGLVH